MPRVRPGGSREFVSFMIRFGCSGVFKASYLGDVHNV
jgi:hypothetical protein